MMTTTQTPRVRQSIRVLQDQYDMGQRAPLEDLVRAWIGITRLPPSSPHSFFKLAGYHGEPFQYRDGVDYMYWGGYCNHGNVLFPTWHRVYVLKVEEALQSIVPGVMMPYWDETDPDMLSKGIPSILTQPTFELDGVIVGNPLYSFELPLALSDHLPGDDPGYYEKPAGYKTVRYPLSGLVGTAEARAVTDAHNAQYPNSADNIGMLNANMQAWLFGLKPTVADPHPSKDGIVMQFLNCLGAPNYTVFSNTTSAGAWNKAHPGTVFSLESPHNDVHLAVGGFDTGSGTPGSQSGQIAGANGDMGENNTAAMDPIFFFHHCNIDRMFWLWQKKHGHTAELSILRGYPGTDSSNNGQGPTPSQAPNTPLDLHTELTPFQKADGSFYRSVDCVDIEKQLGFTYGPGSFDSGLQAPEVRSGYSGKKLHVSGIDRARFQGSFVVRAFATVVAADGSSTSHYLGHHSVLSRFNVVNCANCLTHMEVVAHFPLHSLRSDDVDGARFHVEIQHRAPPPSADPKLLSPQAGLEAAASAVLTVID
jgi:tyrosinase